MMLQPILQILHANAKPQTDLIQKQRGRVALRRTLEQLQPTQVQPLRLRAARSERLKSRE
jgi:hypothetical protein